MSKKSILAGRIISGLVGIFLLTSGINIALIHSVDLMEGFAKFGYPINVMTGIGWAAITGSLLYLVPQTSVLGAIVLTGYLGGAVATHVRVNDPTFIVPLIVGIVVWLGLFLREERLKSLLPLRG